MDNVNQPTPGGSKTGMWVALVIAVIVLGVGAYFLFARDNGTNTANGNVVGNQNATGQSNFNATSNANEVVSSDDWQSYTNTRFGYAVRIPRSWGHVVEFDGSLEYNLNKDNIQDAVTLSLGPSDEVAEGIYIQVDENKSLDEFLSENTSTTNANNTKPIVASSDFKTDSGVSGKKLELVSSATGFDFAYVFQHGTNLIDLRFLKENFDALTVINTLLLTN